MPFYALAITPLIRRLGGSVIQGWYADDAQAGGSLSALRQWWDLIVAEGPKYGYHANAAKTVLVVKPERLHDAECLFEGTGVRFSDGARDLGGAIGSDAFAQKFLEEKIGGLCSELEQLSTIAISSPQASYSAFTHGLQHKWTFLQRTHAGVAERFAPIEEVIREKFIPALFDGHMVNPT